MRRKKVVKVGLLGTGNVARSLAAGWLRTGHKVALGSRMPPNVKADPQINVGTRSEVAKWAEVVVFAVPYTAMKNTVQALGPNALHRKPVIDAMNPINEKGEWAIGFATSGAESLAKLLPGAQVVKAFNTVFAPYMSSGSVRGTQLVALVAGNDADANRTVMDLASDLGFAPVYAGPLRSARYLEAMAMQLITIAYALGKGPKFGFAMASE